MPQVEDIAGFQTMNRGSGIVTGGTNPSATMLYKCDWDDVVMLARAMRGWYLEGGLWNAYRAHVHPTEPMYCADTKYRPHGRPTGTSSWEKALLEVTYKPGVFTDPARNDFIDEQLDFSGEMVDLGDQNWTFEGGTEQVGKQLSKLVPMIAYNITQYHVTSLPLTTMYALLGTLNNATFKGATAGKMLYLGGSASRKIIAIGGLTPTTVNEDWTVNHKFLYANRDLRSEWRSSTGAFEKVIGANGVSKFDLGDMSLLNLGV